jgi:hypothetical protein
MTERAAGLAGRDHLRVAGWIHLAQGAVYGGLMVWWLAWLLPDIITGRSSVVVPAILFVAVVAAFLFFLAAASAWCGRGLLRHDAESRIGAIALSILQLALFPVGTAAGAYVLWVLVSDERSQPLRERLS